jgi:hypothetical protein
LWNAAADRKHVHEQTEDAFLIERLHVRGKVIDYVDVISPTSSQKTSKMLTMRISFPLSIKSSETFQT